MKVSEILKAAKAVIEKPENWTQNFYAKDAEGFDVMGNDSLATCFCSLGAIQKIVNYNDHPGHGTSPNEAKSAVELLNKVTKELSGMLMASFNDVATHDGVMEAWDKAIAQAEAKGV